MDINTIVIVTLLLLIILYLLRERKEVDRRLRAEYENLFEEWKKVELANHAASLPSRITLIACPSIQAQEVIETLCAGHYEIKESQ